MENNAIISIGSNIDADCNIDRALTLIAHASTLLARAPRLATKPIGITDQADFVNTAVKVTTPLPMDGFKAFLKSVEDKVGRDRTRPKYGPREIDLDILEWNGKIVDDDFWQREFLQILRESLRES